MGKSKTLMEPETITKQDNFQQYKQQQRKRTALGRANRERYTDVHEIPLGTLLKQIRIRLRRNWIAFRYQADHLTLGLFRKRFALKAGTIALLVYIFFFSNRQFSIFSGNAAGAEGRGILADNSFGAGNEARSILIPAEEEEYQVKPVRKPKPLSEARKKTSTQPGLSSGSGIGNADPQTKQYVERFHRIAVAEMQRFGVPASISLAQGLLESRCGTSKLALRNNNHFGIKCFSRNCNSGHCSNHSDDTHKDFFRIYNTAWEGWRAHSQMISTGRYAKLKNYGRDYKRWARGLQSLGYATDRTYADKLIGTIERYNLQQYDK